MYKLYVIIYPKSFMSIAQTKDFTYIVTNDDKVIQESSYTPYLV